MPNAFLVVIHVGYLHRLPISFCLSSSLLDKGLLQLSDFRLEHLNLLPAVQWSPVIRPEALHQTLLRLLHLLWKLLNLLALLQLLSEIHDFLLYAVVAAARVYSCRCVELWA